MKSSDPRDSISKTNPFDCVHEKDFSTFAALFVLGSAGLSTAGSGAGGRLFGDRVDRVDRVDRRLVAIGIEVHPDGTRAWVARTNADIVAEVDLTGWIAVRLLTAGKEPDGLALSPIR